MEKKEKVAAPDEELTADQILEKARLEAERIIAEAKEKVATPSAEETWIPPAVAENESRMKEKVKIKLFYDGKQYKDDLYVAVNGKNYQIQRGVEVEVPRYVAEVIANSDKQTQLVGDLINQGVEAAARLDSAVS